MNVGFTGSRVGMSLAQRTTFARVIHGLDIDEFHHGNAIGADREAATLMYDLEWVDRQTGDRWVSIVAHPCSIRSQQCAPPIGDVVLPPRPPLARSRDIVDASRLLIACPVTMQEEERSGTWTTVAYARRNNKRWFIIWPDGTTTEGKG